MIKMLLAAEGVTDFGWKTYDKKAGAYITHDGVLQVLIKKCVDDRAIEIECASRKDLKSVTLLRRNRRADDIKRERLAAYAASHQCDCIVYHMDEDKKGFDVRYELIDGLLSTAREKNIGCMPVVPMRMLESWLLADEESFPHVPRNPQLPKNPEQIWGEESDPESNYPKNYLKRVLQQFELEPGRDCFVELAEKASIDALLQKCPKSFQRFYEDLQDLIPSNPDTPNQ